MTLRATLLEDAVQRAVFEHLKRRGRGVFAFHPKNGGSHQSDRRRAINARLGVVSGVPDVIAIKDGRVFGLELKSEIGSVRESQIETLQKMQSCGATVAVTYGLNESLRKLEEWGLI